MARRALGHAVGVVAVLAAASSCSTSPSGPISLTHLSSPSDKFFSFPSAFQFFLGDTPAEQLVISDAAAWTTLWSQLVSGHRPVPDAPVVDFSQDVVLFTTMGAQPTGGYSTSILSATESGGGRVVVEIVETSPGPSCGGVEVITYPADAVTIPRRVVLHIEFHVATAVRDCGS